MSREFICETCDLGISRLGPDDGKNICMVCQWLRDNTNLTDQERKEIRLRLRHHNEDQISEELERHNEPDPNSDRPISSGV